MTPVEALDALKSAAEPEYRLFNMKLIPGADNILGVRVPEIRRLAKVIARDDDFRDYIAGAGYDYMEQVMLSGMVIGCAQVGPTERLAMIADFVPLITNWAICDTFCSGLKFTTDNRGLVWEFLMPYARSDQPYSARFAAVMYLNYFISAEYLGDIFSALEGMRHDHHYVRMAVAWAVSVCYASYPHETASFLEKCTLEDWTYKKAIAKICESRSVSSEGKAAARAIVRGYGA